MLDTIFGNPGYLVAGGALVSAPIIIHLINRMRFKRLRWAAMEFLLKSQKRNRRRLIIEQLLLLALRCLLVVLAAFLVLRFAWPSLAGGFVGQDGFHVVVLDDTLSMNDRWKENNKDKTCFQVARDEVLLNRLYSNIAQSTTNERLTIIPLSRLVAEADFQPKVYQRLSEESTHKDLVYDIGKLKPTMLHVDLLKGVQRAAALFDEQRDKRHVLHLVSDFRRVDWTGPDAAPLHKKLRELRDKKVRIHATDTAHPYRIKDQTGVQLAHDNVGIVDFRANTKVVGKGMPAVFTVTVANFGANDRTVNVNIVDDLTGKEMAQVDFFPTMPLKVPANGQASASFELRLYPDQLGPNQFFAQRISAHLESANRLPLDDDGLADDNVRYAGIEIRNKVPVLVIDGTGSAGQEENHDSFFIEKAFISVPGGSYDLIYGTLRTLEQPDLAKYPTIFILNVRELSDLQRANLENFVQQGGGVAFFLGEQVSGSYYTKQLYREGKGLFPAPLREKYYPPDTMLQPKFTGDPQLLMRKDLFTTNEEYPIFGQFIDEKSKDALVDLPIKRYFQVPRADWTPEPGKVFELATLPNDKPAIKFQREIISLTNKFPTDNRDFREYWPGLRRHAEVIRRLVAPGSEAKAFQLASALKNLLNDKGDTKNALEQPDLTKFWKSTDPKVRTLRQEVTAWYDTTQFGDPFVVARQFGKGRVAAVLSTAGKEWNEWGGGSLASALYEPFIWEMQNWLASQASGVNLLVGSPIQLDVDAARLKKQGFNQVMMVRSFAKPQLGQPLKVVNESPNFGSPGKGGLQIFRFERNFEPGFYLTQLVPQVGDKKQNLASWFHVFNVDTAHEGKLQRVSQEELNQQQLALGAETREPVITLESPNEPPDTLINRKLDMSEFALYFLIFIIVLVSEQALAVHLSFHLRASEGQLPAQARPAQARAA
jgi:hypothetical protein